MCAPPGSHRPLFSKVMLGSVFFFTSMKFCKSQFLLGFPKAPSLDYHFFFFNASTIVPISVVTVDLQLYSPTPLL